MDAPSRCEPLVIYPTRWGRADRLFLCVVIIPASFVISLVFVVGLCYSLSGAWDEPVSWLGLGVFLLWLSLSVCGLIWNAWELPWLLRRAPLLVINERGV